MGAYLNESLLSGKYGLIYAEDAKQLRKEALSKEVYQGLCLKSDPSKAPGLCLKTTPQEPRFVSK